MIISGVKSRKTPNINKKKYKTELFTRNTSNLSLWSLILNVLPQKTFLLDTLMRVLGPQSRLVLTKKDRKLDGWEELIRKAIRVKAKAKMQSASSCNIDQRCYHKNWLVQASLDKTTKDFKIVESKPKT